MFFPITKLVSFEFGFWGFKKCNLLEGTKLFAPKPNQSFFKGKYHPSFQVFSPFVGIATKIKATLAEKGRPKN